MKLLVTGVSGTGKTTIFEAFRARGFSVVGIDEEEHLSYWANKKTGEPFVGDDVVFDEAFLATHDWVCDLDVLRKLIADKVEPVIVCGSSDNILECAKLCDKTALLQCEPEVFLARIESRTNNNYGKTDAAKSALLSYYEEYNQMLIDAEAVVIDASQPIETVVSDIVTLIED